jgi:hypothetical protein
MPNTQATQSVAEANRFWVDMSQDPILAAQFRKLGIKLSSASATPGGNADTFLSSKNYFTDTDTVIAVYEELLKSSTLPYYGVYNLYTSTSDTRYVLEINSAGVWFDGSKINGYKVVQSVLSWDSNGNPANSSDATLTLSIVEDQIQDSSNYLGPMCKGSVNPVKGTPLTGLIGKRGVFSKDGVTSSDTATDSLTWWEGSYTVMFNAAGTSTTATQGPDLTIDKAGVVTFGGKVQATFANNTLTWESGGNSLNASKGNIVFELSYDNIKRFRGSLVPDVLASSALDTPMNSAGTLFQTMPLLNGELSILTATLPNGIMGAAYTATLVPSGGKPPYEWKRYGDLPAGLTFAPDPTTNAGMITGTPTASTVASLTFTLSDATSSSDSVNLSLTVTDTAPTNVAATSLSVISIIASLSSALLFFLWKRKHEKKDAASKKEADALAKREALDDAKAPDNIAMRDLTRSQNPQTEFSKRRQEASNAAKAAALDASSHRTHARIALANSVKAEQLQQAAEARRDAASDQATKDAEQAEVNRLRDIERLESQQFESHRKAAEAAEGREREAKQEADAARNAEAH